MRAEDYTIEELFQLLELSPDATENEIREHIKTRIDAKETVNELKPFLFQIEHALLQHLRLQDANLFEPPKDTRYEDKHTKSTYNHIDEQLFQKPLLSKSLTSPEEKTNKTNQTNQTIEEDFSESIDLSSLDITKYSEEEILELFDVNDRDRQQILEENKKDVLDIAYRETLQNIRSSSTLSQENKELYIQFVREGRDTLLNKIQERIAIENENAPQASNTLIEESTNSTTPQKHQVETNHLITQDFIDAINNQSNYTIRNALTSSNSDASNHLSRREQTNAIHTDEAPRAIINPLRRQTLTHQVNIDSLFRRAYYTTLSTDFTYEFNYPLRNVISMKLVAMELPNIWYSFSNAKKNNIFYIHFSGVNFDCVAPRDVESSVKIVIPEGNYTPDEFVRTMNAYFRNHEGTPTTNEISEVLSSNTSHQKLHFLRFLRFEFDEITARMIIRTHNINDVDLSEYEPQITLFVPDVETTTSGTKNNQYSPNFEFTLDFELEEEPERLWYRNAGWMIGFQEPKYTINNDVPPFYDTYNTGNTFHYRIQAEGVFGNTINSYVFLSIDDFNHNAKQAIMSGNDNALLYDNILARISVTSGSNTYIVDNASDMIFKKRIYFGPVTINRLHIRLLDRFGDVIDLNSNDMSLALEFQQIYS